MLRVGEHWHGRCVAAKTMLICCGTWPFSTELGDRDRATSHAQAAIDVMEQASDPQAGCFREHLQRYRAGVSDMAKVGFESGTSPDIRHWFDPCALGSATFKWTNADH